MGEGKYQKLIIIVEESIRNITKKEKRSRIKKNSKSYHDEWVVPAYVDALSKDNYFRNTNSEEDYFSPERMILRIPQSVEAGVKHISYKKYNPEVIDKDFTREKVLQFVKKSPSCKSREPENTDIRGRPAKKEFMTPDGKKYLITEFYKNFIEYKGYDIKDWEWGIDEITCRLHHLGFPVL